MTTRRIALVTALVLALPAGAAGQVGEGRPGGRTPPSAEQRQEMRRRLAAALGVAPELVNVRATTTDKLGFAGRGEGLAAEAVALLERG